MEYKAYYHPHKKNEGFDIAKKISEMTNLMEKTIVVGINNKNFRNIDPRLLAIFLAAVTEGMLQLKKLGLFDFLKISDSAFRQFMADTIGQGILLDKGPIRK